MVSSIFIRIHFLNKRYKLVKVRNANFIALKGKIRNKHCGIIAPGSNGLSLDFHYGFCTYC